MMEKKENLFSHINFIRTLELKTNNQWYALNINKEQPYLYLHDLRIEEANKIPEFVIKIKLHYSNNSTSEKPDYIFNLNSRNENRITIGKTVDIVNAEKVEILFQDLDVETNNSIAQLLYYNLNHIDDKQSNSSFEAHIDDTVNSKILFSAPFGEGKSTFLNFFFEQNKKKYEVFKVFPVNYSVAKNEDIFRYIKTDILFQLFGKEVTFDKETFSNNLTAQQYLLYEPKKVFSSVLKIALGLTHPASGIGIVNAISEFEKIFDEIKSFQEKAKIDDEGKAKAYLAEVYEQEGSIYEDNFYTQLIRQLIDQLKIKSKKKTVLVIEDLDRMDPEHIFRILNVISAHYDAYAQYDDKYHNKFGFDKIIIVCHLDNIKNIFEHRYGEKTDFKGYINKFYSSHIYKFDYMAVVHELINEMEEYYRQQELGQSFVLFKVLSDLKILSLRDILKFKYNIQQKNALGNLKNTITKRYSNSSSYFKEGIFTIVIYQIIQLLISKDDLINKLEQSDSDKITLDELDKKDTIKLLLSHIASKNMTNRETIKNDHYSFDIEKYGHYNYIATNIQINGNAFNAFSNKNLVEFLIKAIKSF